MTEAHALQRMTLDEYLAFEAASETKHEWVNGEVYAMAGGTMRHARLAVRVASALERVATPHGCEVFSSDLLVTVEATGRRTYPDLTVLCGPRQADPKNRHSLMNPTMIVEVLSDSTESSDRGDKWRHYRRIESLQTYVLVNTREARIEVYTRSGDAWRFSEAGPGEVAHLGLHDLTLDVDSVYAGVSEDDE